VNFQERLESMHQRLEGKTFSAWCRGPDGMIHFFPQRALVSACAEYHWVQIEEAEAPVTCLQCASRPYEE
jgi:hypothetical protein